MGLKWVEIGHDVKAVDMLYLEITFIIYQNAKDWPTKPNLL